MGTSGPATRLYNPVGFAVMPGSVARSSVLGVLYLPVFPLFYYLLLEATEGTAAGSTLDSFLGVVGWAGITAIGFGIPISATLFLAWLGYRRREYEVGSDGVTERRGILLRSERFFSYDEIEGVTVTQSRTQSMYGCGTVRLTDINEDNKHQVVMKMSYIRNPGNVSTNILRHMTDVTGSLDSELETGSIEELSVDSASISGVSGDTLAASTGGRYLMPSAILNPQPGAAAIHGAVLGLAYGVLGGVVLYVLRDWVTALTGLESPLFLLASAGGAAVAVAAAVAGSLYWTYDRTQYELYEDHITVIRGDKMTTYSTDDVAAVHLKDEGIASLQRGVWSVLALTDVGHIRLRDEQGDVVIEFAFIANPKPVFEALKEWLAWEEPNRATNTGMTAAEGGQGAGDRSSEADDAGVVGDGSVDGGRSRGDADGVADGGE
jgi:hypothetical protein